MSGLNVPAYVLAKNKIKTVSQAHVVDVTVVEDDDENKKIQLINIGGDPIGNGIGLEQLGEEVGNVVIDETITDGSF